MRTRTQNGVIGTTHEASFHRAQQDRVQNELQFFDSTTVKFERTTRGIRAHAKASASSADGGYLMPLWL
jgi:hypothetical protein